MLIAHVAFTAALPLRPRVICHPYDTVALPRTTQSTLPGTHRISRRAVIRLVADGDTGPDDEATTSVTSVRDASSTSPPVPSTTSSAPPPPESKADAQDKRSMQQYSLRTRLREETEAPFRKARMFVYAGSAASASVGAFISALRIIAALTGVSGVQPISETVPNVAVDGAVVALCLLLLRQETLAGERRLERMSRGARIAALRVEDSVTRTVSSLKELRGRQRVVLVGGSERAVAETMRQAEQVEAGLAESNLLVVPFVTVDADEPVATARANSPAEDDEATQFLETLNWRMRPFATQDWKRWYESERVVANAKLDRKPGEVVVVVVRMDGKVGGRSAGAPMWSKLISDIARLPKKDQFGRP